MPKIPVQTAQGRNQVGLRQFGVLDLPNISPESYGAGVGRGAQELAGAMFRLDAHLQDQRNRLEMVDLQGRFETKLLDAKAKILQEPDVSKYDSLLEDARIEFYHDMVDQASNGQVRTAFKVYADTYLQNVRVDLAAEGRKRLAERQIVDSTSQAETLMDDAARLPYASKPEMEKIATATGLIKSLVTNGHVDAIHGAEQQKAMQNRYWEERALNDPITVLNIQATGERPEGMDQQKLGHYVNIANGTINARWAAMERAQRMAEHQRKLAKEEMVRGLTADLLDEKPGVVEQLPTLLRNNEIDDNDARTLHTLQRTLRLEPDLARYDRGLAAEMENDLNARKYDGKPLPDALSRLITDSFLEGRLLKDEFGHLMGVYRGVLDHKNAKGRDHKDKAITHARQNLASRIRTTGPMDKYDALSEEATADALKMFDLRMAQDPEADPWKVQEEATRLFEPVVKSRKMMGDTDQSKLDDARMKSLRDVKAISPATYKAWQERTQEERGRKAVEQAQDELPPPPKPGIFERMMQGIQDQWKKAVPPKGTTP